MTATSPTVTGASTATGVMTTAAPTTTGALVASTTLGTAMAMMVCMVTGASMALGTTMALEVWMVATGACMGTAIATPAGTAAATVTTSVHDTVNATATEAGKPSSSGADMWGSTPAWNDDESRRRLPDAQSPVTAASLCGGTEALLCCPSAQNEWSFPALFAVLPPKLSSSSTAGAKACFSSTPILYKLQKCCWSVWLLCLLQWCTKCILNE